MSVCLLVSFLAVSLLSPCLSISPSVCSPVYLYCTPTHTHIHTHTHLCFSWYFSVISSNTTLSSCLITKQGHYICLHELPSLCGCVCVGVCEAYGHSHTRSHTLTLTLTLTHTHRVIHAPWTLRSTISLLNSLPLISPQSLLFPSLLFFFVFLSYISPISNLF